MIKKDNYAKDSVGGHNNSLVEQMLKRNHEQSELFCSSSAWSARRLYRAKHPTEILWFKCMDGRLNGAVITKTPFGIIQPMRNIAGSFDLGWPYLGEIFLQWVEYSIDHGRRCLPFCTYHFSCSDTHKGCYGHGYDVDKARNDAHGLLSNIEYIFGKEHTVVYPLLVGIETDEDAMILHGQGQELNLAKELETSKEDLIAKIHHLYPDMHDRFVEDLYPLLKGNIEHIRELRANPRPLGQMVHGEQIIAIGRGFDWLHWLNKALIIGPFSYDLADPIAKAAKIVLDNISENRVPASDGALLMTSGVYRNATGPSPRLAELKAKSLERFALDVIKTRVPDLYPYLHVLSGTVDTNTRLFTPLSIK